MIIKTNNKHNVVASMIATTFINVIGIILFILGIKYLPIAIYIFTGIILLLNVILEYCRAYYGNEKVNNFLLK